MTSLQQVLQDIDQLTLEEQFEVLNHTAEQLKRQAVTQNKPKRGIAEENPRPKRKWSDLKGMAPYPMMGEDAQEWVSRTRREGDEHRDRLSRGE
ncbi:hypothetical protein [Leptolyngbya sp. NIES-2104]|uniref:hypothetical protein n=1 Tax=Leptolyngbya sp. NIES-2104 TaxID=1552121 RepID=UPI0006EC7F43|nr:hypothetical protein [Leptolyngbya sp. NIES-2104]GAQ00152.1 hypothetical protein NIES2104_67170 [Leptolyngbya sp. NIES-2104]